MRVEIFEQVDRAWWNGLVEKSPHGCIYQTCSWMEYLREFMRYDVRYLVCYDTRDQVKGLLAVGSTIPGVDRIIERPFDRILVGGLKRILPLFTWQKGPVLLGDEEEWEEILSALFAAVLELAKSAPIRNATLPLKVESFLPKWVAEKFAMRRWATYLLPLEGEEEALWKSLKSSARKSIRRAQNDGIAVDTVEGEEGREGFQVFRRECLRRKGVRCLSVDNLLVRYRWLQPIGGEDIYLAKIGEEVLCSLGIFRFNGILFEFGANQSQASYDRKLYGGDLLKWEIMRRERERGGRFYDLSGVNPQPRDAKEKGIDQFKKKWGGEFVEYPILTRR